VFVKNSAAQNDPHLPGVYCRAFFWPREITSESCAFSERIRLFPGFITVKREQSLQYYRQGAFRLPRRTGYLFHPFYPTMKKITFLFVIALITSSHTFAQISWKKVKEKATTVASAAAPLSEGDIAKGLKEALTVGSKNAASQLNKQDGFLLNPKVRIPFPEDAQRVATKLRELGFGKKVDQFELTLNRAAEDAAKEAAPIFVNAITSMTITDAKNILTGSDNAATSYLQGKTSDPLAQAFSPHIKKALDATAATRLWSELTTLYNRIPLVTKVETNLTKYTTDRALKGMFTVVADEELKIRKDPAARVTDLLKRVFGSNAS
jgi:hypothetical protein